MTVVLRVARLFSGRFGAVAEGPVMRFADDALMLDMMRHVRQKCKLC